MKWLNKQVSMLKDKEVLSFVIEPQMKQWEQTLLMSWITMWYISGGIIAYNFYTLDKEQKLFVFVFFIFWAYYAFKITRIFFWKKKGAELIRVKEGELQYKQSIGKLGKLKRYPVANIEKIETTPAPEKGFLSNIENSFFWTMGTPTLLIKYKGKYLKLGYISDQEVQEQVFNLLKDRFNKELKKDI